MAASSFFSAQSGSQMDLATMNFARQSALMLRGFIPSSLAGTAATLSFVDFGKMSGQLTIKQPPSWGWHLFGEWRLSGRTLAWSRWVIGLGDEAYSPKKQQPGECRAVKHYCSGFGSRSRIVGNG